MLRQLSRVDVRLLRFASRGLVTEVLVAERCIFVLSVGVRQVLPDVHSPRTSTCPPYRQQGQQKSYQQHLVVLTHKQKRANLSTARSPPNSPARQRRSAPELPWFRVRLLAPFGALAPFAAPAIGCLRFLDVSQAGCLLLRCPSLGHGFLLSSIFGFEPTQAI